MGQISNVDVLVLHKYTCQFMPSCGAGGALMEKVPVYATALVIHVPMLSCTWLKENIFDVCYMKGNYFLVIFW